MACNFLMASHEKKYNPRLHDPKKKTKKNGKMVV
jgi:hypothetical protein